MDVQVICITKEQYP